MTARSVCFRGGENLKSKGDQRSQNYRKLLGGNGEDNSNMFRLDFAWGTCGAGAAVPARSCFCGSTVTYQKNQLVTFQSDSHMMTFLAASLTLALALAELSPVDDEDSCHIDPEGFCVTEGPGEGFGEGGEKRIEGESGQFRFDILRRIGSQPTNGSNFVYDTAGVLEEETVKQLMNVSGA
eukprot:221515-Amorphochlora_amoeboformis.AAC.1